MLGYHLAEIYRPPACNPDLALTAHSAGYLAWRSSSPPSKFSYERRLKLILTLPESKSGQLFQNKTFRANWYKIFLVQN